jgi:FAD synthetase
MRYLRLKHISFIGYIKSFHMKKVMAMGTFDLIHRGHKYFLREAKKKGDYLIVLVARDKTVWQVKGKTPLCPEKCRRDAVASLGIADKVVLGSLKDKYATFKKERPNIICLGYDQEIFVDKLRDKLKEMRLTTKIVRLKSYKPHLYKSSKLKRSLKVCAMKNYIYPTGKKRLHGRVK